MSQPSSNTLIDLFERIKVLLTEGRIDIVYSVAKKPDLDIRLRNIFHGLADLLTQKNNEINDALQVHRFYRQCIRKIIERDQLDLEDQQYSQVNQGIKQHIQSLEVYVFSLFQQIQAQSKQLEKKDEALKQSQTRAIIYQSEKDQLKNKIAKLIGEKQGNSKASEQIKNLKDKLNLKNNQCMQLVHRTNLIKHQSQMKNDEINKFKSELKKCQQLLRDLKQEGNKKQKTIQQLQKMLQQTKFQFSQIMQVDNKNLEMSLQQKDQQIQQLKARLENDNLISRSLSQKLNESVIFKSIKQATGLPFNLKNAIEECINYQIQQVNSIYNYSVSKRSNLQNHILDKENILLVCKTNQNKIIGAFTSASYSLKKQPLDSKAFLFGLQDNKISISPLKRGKVSLYYDPDFLIFGKEQICIERNQSLLTSQYQSLSDSQRHFMRPKQDADYFSNILSEDKKVKLKNYEIFQIIVKRN